MFVFDLIRFCHSTRKVSKMSEKTETNSAQISFDGIETNHEKSVDGIFHEMIKRCGNQNPHNLKLIQIIPSDSICDTYPHVIEENFKSHWFTYVPDPSLTFDFKDYSVLLNGYSLTTYSGGTGYAHLKSWDLEGSDDNKEWTVIHSVRDSDLLNGEKRSAYFPLRSEKSFRYIRLHMIGKSWSGADFMVVRGIEFYGSVHKI